MIDSTAHAEPVSLQSVSTPAFSWGVTGKPVRVRLPLALIDRMEREVVENFRSLTSRGSEIGGILLGSVTPGNPAAVRIEDYEVIPCDYARGPLYRLSESDMGRFERAIERHMAEGESGVVGFFRSHTRKGLALDAEDLSFFGARFRDPSNVILLVRPFATKASTAGFFIWEDGAVHGDASYLEFPFRSSQLASSRPSLSAMEAPRAGHPTVSPAAPAPPAPASPKPPVRAQIVPIAPRREILLPFPPEAPAEPPIEWKEAEPGPVPVAAAPAKTEEPEEKRAVIPPAEDKIAEAPQPSAAAALPMEKPAALETGAVEAPAAEADSGRGWRLVAAILAASVLILGTVLFLYPGMLRNQGHAGSISPDTPPLSLRVERTGTDILLTWNRDSDAIRHATRAVLTISDGERHENYDMDLGQLRNGSIVYSPLTTDVSFRMEVAGQGNAKGVSESVRVLRTRPSPMPDGSDAAARNSAKPTVKAAAPPDAGASGISEADDSNAEPEPVPARTVVAAKPFNAESLGGRLRAASPAETSLPEAPVLKSNPIAASALPPIGAAPVVPAPFVPAPAPAAPEKRIAAVAAPAGGQIVQAQVVYSKQPDYPKLARQMGIKGTVDLVATIGTDGHVKSVKVEKGHPMLVKAATDAVMQWTYRPTLLNGTPVQNETHITLNFTGDK